MSGEAAQQVLDTSVDTVGLSIVSATQTAVAPRNGSMYNPVALAAGVPIHFHALQNGQYVAVFRSHWINATMGTGGPQSYTDLTEAGSCWVRVAPPSGATVTLGQISTRVPGSNNLVINAACSRVDFLYTVGNLDGMALIQHHRISEEGLVLLQAEEVMFPAGNLGVTFDRGCYIEGEYLVVLGADADGKLFMVRRRWGRIGQPDPTPRYTWEYRSAKGWLADVTTLETIGITSVGPVSVARFKDRLLLATVVHTPGADPNFSGDGLLGATLITDVSRSTTTDTHPVADDYSAVVYSARATDPFGRWKRIGSGVPLGDDGTYFGGTLYFQMLNVNQVQKPPPDAVAQVPYVHSVRAITGDEQAINTVWGLWPITSNV